LFVNLVVLLFDGSEDVLRIRVRLAIQASHSSAVVRITGMAFGWIGSTIAFGAVVRKP
jgi:spore coat polysaccharide biosynthesis protein SpsF (cytidylyltransferase family)